MYTQRTQIICRLKVVCTNRMVWFARMYVCLKLMNQIWEKNCALGSTLVMNECGGVGVWGWGGIGGSAVYRGSRR